MTVWHKNKKEDFGTLLLAWRHRASGRFIMKVGSWILGAFVMGLLAAIFFHTINMDVIAQNAGRLAFLIVFLIGITSAFFRHIYYGLDYHITDKALVAIRPMCGFEGMMRILGSWAETGATKFDYLPWEEVKEVKEEKGSLLMMLKEQKEPFKIGVTPVRALILPLGSGKEEKRTNRGGLFGKDNNLDKETLRLILQKYREVKKTGTPR